MNKYRKKYQNALERKNPLTVISKDHNTIESLENQSIDGFCVDGSFEELYMQRMGQLRIICLDQRRYNNLDYNKNQIQLLFPRIPRKVQLRIQPLDNFMIKVEKKCDHIVQNQIDFNITRTQNKKAFKNKAILEKVKNQEMEIPRSKDSFIRASAINLYLKYKPKNIKFTDLKIDNNSNIKFNWEINQIKRFKHITIESIPELFIPEQQKKKYYSINNTENVSITGSERPDFCLEIDPNEEIFIPNVYDMLLLQNNWDDLVVRSFRICLKSRGGRGRNLQIVSNKNLYEISQNISEKKEEKRKDGLKEFYENNKSIISKDE